MTSPHPTHADALLDELEWTRRLARSLVRDDARADDLVQDAWLAARKTAEPKHDWSRWLRGVVGNLARQERRAEQRRDEREQRAARAESVDAADELVLRAELQRRVVEAVLGLEEPYRTTVLRRHFAEHTPRRIAEDLGVEPATVESRLTRAHAMLRGRLERELGSCSALWILVRGEDALLPWMGMALMKTKLVVAAVLLAAAGGWWWVERDAAPSEPSESAALAVTTPAGTPSKSTPEAAPVPATTPSERSVSSPATTLPAERAPSVAIAATTYAVRGRVLDADGRAVGGVVLALEGGEETRVTSGADGAFVVNANADDGRARVADERWAAVRAGVWQRRSMFAPLVIVAPPLELAGRVVSGDGAPLEHARIAYRLPDGFESRFETVLEGSELPGWCATSAHDGRFAFATLPAIAGAQLRVTLDGYAPTIEDAPLAGSTNVVLTLVRPNLALVGALRGRVVDADGRGIAEARVACGLVSVASGADGAFELDLTRAVTADAVTAAKAGFLPDRVERPGEVWTDTITLRLSAPTLSLAGVVVDEAGKPCAGVKVWIADPTPFGVLGAFPAPLEGLLAGAAIPPQVFEARVPEHDGDNFFDSWMEVGPPSAFWNWVTTDHDGRFRLEGLVDRDYRIGALSEKPLALETSEPFAAGRADVRVTLPLAERWTKFRGRVLDDFGAPLAGVGVAERINVVDTTGRVFGGRSQLLLFQPGQRVETDDAGWFELADVPKRGVLLDFEGDRVLPESAALAASADPEHWTIALHSRCQLQVVLAAPTERGDQVRALDESGRQLDLLLIRGGNFNAFTEVDVVDGRSTVFSVSSAARTLVLLANGAEVARASLALSPTSITTVGF
ncbi:MAG: sigma-70 family RNA polymerase sigma factor [Planctomycetes bacterium]|nr:sigma-70 family RNA polymerase sigma factor [Planctomycetota bacterium]